MLPNTILLYLIGSVLFCLLAVEMAGADIPLPMPQINNPKKQLKIAAVLFASAVAVHAALSFTLHNFKPLTQQIAFYAFYVLLIASAVCAAAVNKDRPDALGLSTKRIVTLAFFLIPPAGLAFLPGGFANWGFLLRGLAPAAALSIIARTLFLQGYLQTRLQSALGDIKGVFVAAAAVTILNIVGNIGLMKPEVIAVFAAGTFVIAGVLMGFIYRRSGNIFGLVILNIFWDTAVKVFAGMGVGN